ncbi:hypothetical protein [uncultured Formosa sp.]|uniref:hypothetical protein n=1 Tax=uncultured Formosa sp. TaxID=255435 RepID=UPI00261CE12C|nr:hypothetical protein [uncultured Formosa sp.]
MNLPHSLLLRIPRLYFTELTNQINLFMVLFFLMVLSLSSCATETKQKEDNEK